MRKVSRSKSPGPKARVHSFPARSAFVHRARLIGAMLPNREDPSLLPDNREWFAPPADAPGFQLGPSGFPRTRPDPEIRGPEDLRRPCAEVAARLSLRCANAELPARASRSSASEY